MVLYCKHQSASSTNTFLQLHWNSHTTLLDTGKQTGDDSVRNVYISKVTLRKQREPLDPSDGFLVLVKVHRDSPLWVTLIRSTQQGSIKSGCFLHSSSYCAWLSEVVAVTTDCLGSHAVTWKAISLPAVQVKVVFFFTFCVRKHCILSRGLKTTSLSSSSVNKIYALSLRYFFFVCVYVCFSFVFPSESHAFMLYVLGENTLTL